MGFVHACLFCGWSRDAATAVIIAPRCEGCGCVLVSSPRRAPEPPALPALGRGPYLPPALGWLAKWVAAATVVAAGAKIGFDAGGFWLGGVGFSAAGLFAVPPLVPESHP